MTRKEALALVRKVGAEGLPHDIYAQNYTGSGRWPKHGEDHAFSAGITNARTGRKCTRMKGNQSA
jgi:hypothetical protein